MRLSDPPSPVDSRLAHRLSFLAEQVNTLHPGNISSGLTRGPAASYGAIVVRLEAPPSAESRSLTD